MVQVYPAASRYCSSFLFNNQCRVSLIKLSEKTMQLQNPILKPLKIKEPPHWFKQLQYSLPAPGGLGKYPLFIKEAPLSNLVSFNYREYECAYCDVCIWAAWDTENASHVFSEKKPYYLKSDQINNSKIKEPYNGDVSRMIASAPVGCSTRC